LSRDRPIGRPELKSGDPTERLQSNSNRAEKLTGRLLKQVRRKRERGGSTEAAGATGERHRRKTSACGKTLPYAAMDDEDCWMSGSG